MSEYATLHSVSLLLVGSSIKVNPYDSTVTTESTEDSQSSDPVPDDEMFTDCQQTRNITSSNFKTQGETTGIEVIMKPQQDKGVLVLVNEVSSGPDEARWRAHGLARRRTILEDDKRNGGRNFSLSFDCSVQRYFSVAHWALEQFHQLYQSNFSTGNQQQLEEIYVMGFRIIAFLTECLPQHPELSRAPFVQDRSETELVLLRKCLNEVALRIDEVVCNEFVDDGDLLIDSMIAAEMEKEDTEQFESWVNFDEFKKLKQKSTDGKNRRKLSESPTSETVGTSETESLESLDSSHAKSNSSVNSSREKMTRRIPKREKSERTVEETEEDYFGDDDRVIREDRFEMDELLTEMDDLSVSSYSSQPFKLLKKSVSLDFLKTIACEPVLYETDSEAADSWANGDDNTTRSRPCLPSSTGETPTSDPARIAFRSLMDKLPHKSILKRGNWPSSNKLEPPRPSSPTFSDIMEERDSVTAASIDDENLDEVVEREIQDYLDQKLGKQNKKLRKMDKKLRKNSREQSQRRSRRKDQHQKPSVPSDDSSSSSKSSSSYTSLASLKRRTGSQTSAFSSFSKTKQKQHQEKPVAPESFVVQDDWISFDNFTGGNDFASASM